MDPLDDSLGGGGELLGEDACDGDSGLCLMRGGGYSELSGQLACSTGIGIPRLVAWVSFGFRCCSD